MNEKRCIGIIGAMESETEKLISLMEEKEKKNICNIDFYTGKLRGKNVVICTSSEGKVNSAMALQIMICNFSKLALVVDVGVAGSLDDSATVYDTVIASSCTEHDYNIESLGYDRGMVLGINKIKIPVDNVSSNLMFEIARRNNSNNSSHIGNIASGDIFVSDKNMAKKINQKFQSIAVDMESAAIAHVCYSNYVKCVILRVISDSSNGIEFKEFVSGAIEIATTILLEFIHECSI